MTSTPSSSTSSSPATPATESSPRGARAAARGTGAVAGAAGQGRPRGPGLFSLLAPYRHLVAGIVLLTLAANGLNLLVPRLVARAIDTFATAQVSLTSWLVEFVLVAAGIFALGYVQNIVQTVAAERVARDLRTRLVAKISAQDPAFVQRVTPATLLTNLTADVDAVKLFVSQAVGSLVSSVFLIIGASTLLLMINWRLGLAVLAVLPVIGLTFGIVLGRVRKQFTKAQQALDRLNKVINESILGAGLIRLLNAQFVEHEKFLSANAHARDISLTILRLFASLIPIIMFCTNLATLAILTLGGRFVIAGGMTLGDFAAFNSYLSILIFPVILLGFMSNVMAQAGASFARVGAVLNAPPPPASGTITTALTGQLSLHDVSVRFGDKDVLRHVTVHVRAGSRTAIIGPTAAGKTQLLYLLTGLLAPTSGSVTFDGRPLTDYSKDVLQRHVGCVFQEAALFNLTLRENIAFSPTARDEDLAKAVSTAELSEFVGGLPAGLDTVVSERGTSLSGGQKQRLMLARALALNPTILLLDDFTARVDTVTERRILDNVRREYPGVTLVSVTQKIAPVEDYDQIVLLMEGEVLASGTHAELLESCPEYVQIYDSQRSTRAYESVPAR